MSSSMLEPLDAEALPSWQRKRRVAILDAARRLLSGNGYQHVQIRDVALEAGVALGTLYRYFPSKEHLYAAALRAWGLDLESTVVTAPASTALEHLRAKTDHILKEFRQHPELLGLFQHLAISSEPAVIAMLETTATSGKEWLAQELAALGYDEAREISTILWGVITLSIQDEDIETRIVDRFFRLLASTLPKHEAPSASDE